MNKNKYGSAELMNYESKTNINPGLNSRSTSKSAFESDPDLLLLNSKGKDMFLSSVNSERNLFGSKNYLTGSLGIKPKSSSDMFSLKPSQSVLSLTDKSSKKINYDIQRTSSEDSTIESSHLDSDPAKSPIFPLDAYGSRPPVLPSEDTTYSKNKIHKEGIYNKNSSAKYDVLKTEDKFEIKKELLSSTEKSISLTRQDFLEKRVDFHIRMLIKIKIKSILNL